MLQEASGAAGHPSYRRYHYGSGPLLVEDGGSRRFISTDALGSTTDLTTTGATVASMRKYDAWGQYRNDTAPLSNEPKLGFTGHQYDTETGLVYARARYYDPEMGRFLSRDSVEGTIGDAPSLHRFMYVRGNPLRYTDPDGNSDTAADAARRWEEQRAAYRAWLLTQLKPDDSFAKRAGLAATTLSVELGAGMMELFKLGEGAAEGGWRGWGKDALRAVSLGLMMKGSVRMAKEPAPDPAPQAGRPPPPQAKVVEEPAGPAGDAGGTSASSQPTPGRPSWGTVGAMRQGDPFDPEPPTPPSSPSRPAAPEPGPAPGGKTALPDDALVCRGGTCTAERFATGSGVKVGPDGKLSGVSVNSAPGAPLEEVTKGIPNKQVGVTTVGEIKAAGGEVTPAPTARNPIHAEVSGITAEQAEELFTPTVPNPSAR